MSLELQNEIDLCNNDITYFVSKYCMIKTKKGNEPIVLRDYQKRMLKIYQEFNNLNEQHEK